MGEQSGRGLRKKDSIIGKGKPFHNTESMLRCQFDDAE